MVIVLVGLVIGYLVLAYFAARTWHVWHVVLLTGVFFSSILFAYLAAANLKTQMKFRKQHADAVKNVEREEQRKDLLVNGDPLGGEDAVPSMMALEGDVKRALLSRGRVWRNIGLAALDEVDGKKSITLNTSQWGNPAASVSGSGETEEEPAGEENPDATPAGPGPLGLDVGAVVFAFRNTPVAALPAEQQAALFGAESELLQNDQNGAIRVPTAYLGEFSVTAVAADNTSITLQ
ncbi:MAG: hypothetical protein KDB27_00305, partial [Planctomycetales bacterium]|nr:hypothetical protein [Planctomycetales bacterium]